MKSARTCKWQGEADSFCQGVTCACSGLGKRQVFYFLIIFLLYLDTCKKKKKKTLLESLRVLLGLWEGVSWNCSSFLLQTTWGRQLKSELDICLFWCLDKGEAQPARIQSCCEQCQLSHARGFYWIFQLPDDKDIWSYERKREPSRGRRFDQDLWCRDEPWDSEWNEGPEKWQRGCRTEIDERNQGESLCAWQGILLGMKPKIPGSAFPRCQQTSTKIFL